MKNVFFIILLFSSASLSKQNSLEEKFSLNNIILLKDCFTNKKSFFYGDKNNISFNTEPSKKMTCSIYEKLLLCEMSSSDGYFEKSFLIKNDENKISSLDGNENIFFNNKLVQYIKTEDLKNGYLKIESCSGIISTEEDSTLIIDLNKNNFNQIINKIKLL